MQGVTLVKSAQDNDAPSVLEFCPAGRETVQILEGGKARVPGIDRTEGWGDDG